MKYFFFPQILKIVWVSFEKTNLKLRIFSLFNVFLFLFLHCLFSFGAGNLYAQEFHSKIRGAVENREYRIAFSELQNLKSSDPEIFYLNNFDYLLARMAEKTGDFAAAAENYQSVVQRNSVLNEYALWHLSQIARSSGNLFLERIYLEKIAVLAPDSLLMDAVKMRLARSSFESKNYDLTIQMLERGDSVGGIGEKKPALTAGKETAASQKPQIESRESNVLLGQAFLQSGRLDEAKQIFERLISAMPNPGQPDDFALTAAKHLDGMAVGKENSAKTVPSLTDYEHLRRAQIYHFNRDFARARLHFSAIIENHKQSGIVPDALYQIGRGHAQERAFDLAGDWFERVLAEFPEHPISKDALNQLAAAYSRVNKPKEAISRYQKFIEKYPNRENTDRAYLNIIDILRDSGAATEALKWTARTRETFRGKLPEAIALFTQARIYITQTDWQNALRDLNELQNFSDLGGTRVAGGTNKTEVLFLKGFVLENMRDFSQAIDVYLSIPDGRNEYYGWRATERLKALANNEKSAFFITKKINELNAGIENQNADAQRKSAQSILRLTENQEIRRRMLEILKRTYAVLPEYQKIPGGEVLELGRKEILREKREIVSENRHKVLADELLFLGLYDEATPELEISRQTLVGSVKKPVETKTENPANLNYTLAVFYKRGDMAHRTAAFIEPLWRNIPADFQIELVPPEQLEMLYPAPYADALLRFAPERKVDARFLLSIMRQESRFRPDVKSNAAARGLMQFISTTSDRIAGELKLENFRQDELYNPPSAILFGSQYISNLFRQFPNQPPAVAASYNGGEDNMARWLTRAKSEDPDRYVPEILFSQTKDYVYRVMANYRVYQFIYDENLRRTR